MIGIGAATPWMTRLVIVLFLIMVFSPKRAFKTSTGGEEKTGTGVVGPEKVRLGSIAVVTAGAAFLPVVLKAFQLVTAPCAVAQGFCPVRGGGFTDDGTRNPVKGLRRRVKGEPGNQAGGTLCLSRAAPSPGTISGAAGSCWRCRYSWRSQQSSQVSCQGQPRTR